MKKILLSIFLILVIGIYTGCSSYKDYSPSPDGSYVKSPQGEFNPIIENPFIDAGDNPNANVSLSVNTASYTILENAIYNRINLTADSVRPEEMINYFKYESYTSQNKNDFSLNYGLIDTPWNSNSLFLTVGLKASEIETKDIQSNIVFLIDVSGSMFGADRLALVQQAFVLMVENMGENDKISIVTYASGVRVVADSLGFNDKDEIIKSINNLQAGGSTAGAGGIQKAVEIAKKNYIDGENSNNRIVIATDGDFNVGISNTKDLEDYMKTLSSEDAEKRIRFSVIGVGAGNSRDTIMTSIANAGQGNYNYIYNLQSAKKVLIEEAGGTLYTVAEDAKARVSFNADVVKEYRLIGYENRQLTDEEFEDSNTDAGEIGSGHAVTAVFEIILKENAEKNDKIGEFIVKYKLPNTTEEIEKTFEIKGTTTDSARLNDVNFISAVVEFALILRNSEYAPQASINNILSRLEEMDLSENEYKNSFKDLVSFYNQNYQ